VLILAVSTSLFAQTKPAKKKVKAKALPVVQAPPLPPPAEVTLAPLTLAQKPAVPPKVQYQNGQLAILAENCTLGDILRAVHQQTGAVVDLPPNATERVVANLGPGPSRDVLATLLNGSSFNYVMLGSATDPNDVRHVIVTSKPGGDTGSLASNGPQPGFNGRTPLNPPQNGPTVTGGAPIESDSEPETSEDGEAATDDQPQPDDQSPAEGQAADQAGQPENQPQIKTPEQLLQELQRQQQMQQQQQAPQSAPQGFPPPPQNPEPQDQER
jgi:hypothetical protein